MNEGSLCGPEDGVQTSKCSRGSPFFEVFPAKRSSPSRHPPSSSTRHVAHSFSSAISRKLSKHLFSALQNPKPFSSLSLSSFSNPSTTTIAIPDLHQQPSLIYRSRFEIPRGLMDAARISPFFGDGVAFRPRSSPFMLRSRSLSLSPVLMADSISVGETFESLTPVKQQSEKEISVSPVYKPTPSNRNLRTPHSGYHFDGSTRRFFEGWYFKVAIPEHRQSFCFMYSVENPAFPNRLESSVDALYRPQFTGVGAQILGADDKYICQFSEETNNFWGSRHELILGNTFTSKKGSAPPKGEVPPQDYNSRVLEGFQVSPIWHQGFIRDNERSTYARTVKTACWEYSTRPVYGWGDVKSKQKSTAGWLAAFPVFEPHWQICMAGGVSTGWIEWDGERFEFENAPSYSEKNWGGAFPKKWFWVQCNVFQGATGEVSLTAAGGIRKLPGFTENFEDAGLIGVHYNGTFYEFVPWTSVVNWEVAPWGYWNMSAENKMYKVELEATTKDPGTTLRAPTMEAGLAPACKDTCSGDLRLQLWERRYDGSKGKLILDVTSDMAAVEVGGGPWFDTWKGTSTSPELISRALRVPVDVDGFFDLVPIFKPPGL